MSSKTSIMQPQSQAGILGSVGVSGIGIKLNPRTVAVASILFIVVVKILDKIIATGR